MSSITMIDVSVDFTSQLSREAHTDTHSLTHTHTQTAEKNTPAEVGLTLSKKQRMWSKTISAICVCKSFSSVKQKRFTNELFIDQCHRQIVNNNK